MKTKHVLALITTVTIAMMAGLMIERSGYRPGPGGYDLQRDNNPQRVPLAPPRDLGPTSTFRTGDLIVDNTATADGGQRIFDRPGTALARNGGTPNQIDLNITPTTCPGGQAEISTAADGTSLCAPFTLLSGLTTNQMIKATSASTVGDSTWFDNGTTTGTATDIAITNNQSNENRGLPLGPPPSAPTPTTNGAGPLTGTYNYKYIETTAAADPPEYTTGSPAGTVVAAANTIRVTVPLPRRGTGERLVFRTSAGGSDYKYVHTFQGSYWAATIWDDTVADGARGIDIPVVDTTHLYTWTMKPAVKALRTHPDQGFAPADLSLFTGDASHGGSYSLDSYGEGFFRIAIGDAVGASVTAGNDANAFAAYFNSNIDTGAGQVNTYALRGEGWTIWVPQPQTTAHPYALEVQATGSGSDAGQTQQGIRAILKPGYTGAAQTYAILGNNQSAGTDRNVSVGGTTTGAGTYNYGGLFRAQSGTHNVAICASLGIDCHLADGGTGVAFDAVLLLDNGTTGKPLITATSNGNTVLQLLDGGGGGVLAGTVNGWYLEGNYNDLSAGYEVNTDAVSTNISYHGYEGGTTRFRSTTIWNGKETALVTIAGATGFVTIAQSASVGGTFAVTGTSTFTGTVAAVNNETVGGTLIVTGTTTLNSTASINATASITAGTLATSNTKALSLSATLTAVATAAENGVLFDITSAGSSAQIQRGMVVDLEAGYTGASQTQAFQVTNASATTGTSIGIRGDSVGAAGRNVALYGTASGGTVNVAILGVLGSESTTAHDAVMVLDNGSSGKDLLQTYNNGTLIMEQFSDGSLVVGGASYLDSSGIECARSTNAAADCNMNVQGYLAGTTQFRNLRIFDGKSALIAKFTGSNKDFTLGTQIFRQNAPSANHGTLDTGSTDFTGAVTGIGAFTSVTLTYSAAFGTTSWCIAQPNSVTIPELIYVTKSASAPVFNCVNSTTGVAANCDDFTYRCIGK